MHLRHVISQMISRTTRRFPILRRISITLVVIFFTWCYVLHWGERTVYSSHVLNCDWNEWENWPQNAAPHHLVFVTDPQLVDPHTYPGRPWPLNTLTEMYTDLYMSRNFRLINQHLDPDSIVFLGDLFDGGREWATPKPRALLPEQVEFLKEIGVILRDEAEEKERQNQLLKESFLHSEPSGTKSAQVASPTNQDYIHLHQFVPGENGRWLQWGAAQWEKEYDRFGKIFFAPEQLYPRNRRKFLPEIKVTTDPASVVNGAPKVSWTHYSTKNGKQRRIITNLPGNHDVGFGAGVQLPVRDRFHSHFGDTNNVNIFGNHTFISLDTPSLSAYEQFTSEGTTSEVEQSNNRHIWKPASGFLDTMRAPVKKEVEKNLNQYFPGSHSTKGFSHRVTDDLADKSVTDESLSSMPKLPVVLLSHVPFFRNADTDCGNLREKGHSIAIQRGYQYQNVLTKDLSTLIMKKFSMAKVGNMEYIFSGDDHDYCDVTHMYNVGMFNNEANKMIADMARVREITVKSFSWAMGVRRPGFQLLSLWNPVDKDGHTIGVQDTTIQTQLCILPDQLSIFISYASLFVLTMLVLVARAAVIGMRRNSEWEDEDMPGLPLFQQKLAANLNGRSSGYTTPDRVKHLSKNGRQRASSTSTATAHGSSTNLSVQRSFNARTRSVSPAVGSNYNSYDPQQTAGAPLIEKAGYYPQLRWDDPNDSDEESHLGEELQEDSQAKWKKKRKAASRARRLLNEFCISVVLVGIPCAFYYWLLIRNG